jgi:protein-glutamine gamma-glutamyltransferase
MSSPASNQFGTRSGWPGQARRHLRAWLQPQVSSGARDRRDIMVLLVAVSLAVAPHFSHLPLWSSALICVLWFWRAWLTVARRPPPGRFAMVPLVVAASALVWLQHGTILGHEAGVNLLVLLMGMKLLELRNRRDLYIVVFLTFFVQITMFLYDQSLLFALLSICTTLLLFFILLSINLAETDLTAGRKAKMVLSMFIKAIPLIIALFVLFPRLPRPLWAYVDPESSSTGLSDKMSPGSINQLVESDAVVLRAQFTGPVPAPDKLYWRGPVFGHFDGRTWTAQRQQALTTLDLSRVRVESASATQYTVTLEPTRRNWIIALELPLIIDGSPDIQSILADDLQPLAGASIVARVRYRVRSYTSFRVGPTEPDADLAQWLELPPNYNPRTLQFVSDLRNQILDPADRDPHARDAALVNAVINHFRRGGFHYTLRPPALDRNSVDDFLFRTRLGFCEHYASAFVFMMRALNIPARIVTGYQGGEINPVDGYLTVRQSDAHAWAEVWLRGRGWIRMDPTAAVSPVRIEKGEAELASQLGWRHSRDAGGLFGWVGAWRMNWEAMENVWNQWVLNYSSERQRSLMFDLGVDPSWRNLTITFGGTIAGLLLLLAALSLGNRRRQEPLAQLVGQLRVRLAAAGFQSPASEGLTQLQQRLEPWLAPGQRAEAADLLASLQAARYSPSSNSVKASDIRRLRGRVRRFRPRPSKS